MRRFLTLVCLLGLAIPAGISISGCTRNPDANYCNGLGYGLKITDVESITLTPQTLGISIAFGQTRQINSPTAKTCKGTAAGVSSYSYGTSNNQLLDISPSGNMCAGTWNRNTGGGIANYTICYKPNPMPSTGGLPYATVYVTASAQSVTSNPVEIYVHSQVTSITLAGPQSCLSQNQVAQLDAQACFVGANNQQQLLCAPPGTTVPACSLPFINGVSGPQVPLSSIPDCTAAIGALSYTVGTASVATINSETNQITAAQPGTTVITASVAQSGSSAGYFSTCPPKSINVTLANGATSGIITQGVQQNLTTTIIDTQGNPITGLTLDYQSTDPIDITAFSGAINTNFPGVASVFAICQPSTCNPSPINVIGVNGTGLSITSNPVTITTPGTASDYVWFAAPTQSQYFVPVELLTGTVGSTVRLPYVPNSLVMDQLGTSLYFGSSHELMVFSTSTNSLTKTDTSAPGVVLAVTPTDTQLLINDQIRKVFYLYSATGGISATFGGMGGAAAWTPDAKTLYVVDSKALNYTPENIAAGITGHTDTLYVYNLNTGWTTYPLAPSGPGTSNPVGAQSVAITIPSVGAFLSGSPTVAHTWCPSGNVNNSASILFYPQGAPPDNTVPVETDVLAATTDGEHILGAASSATSDTGPITLSDIGVTIPTTQCPGAGTNTLTALNTDPKVDATVTFNQVAASAVNQVVASPASNLAFLTYQGSSTTNSALLPYYVPGSDAPGYLPLTGSSTIDPIAGAFSPDNSLFFVSTTGDNLIHYISVSDVLTNPAKADTQQISPNLPACLPVAKGGVDAGCTYSGTGTVVPATVITVKPRSTT